MNRSRQRGVVLIISLVVLVVLTLFVISSTRLATGNLLIIGNVQSKHRAESMAQIGVEQVLSNITPFYAPTSSVAVDAPSGMTVTVADRTCLRATTAPGYSAVTGMSPEDTFWNVEVSVTDAITGAAAVTTQGVRIRLPAGNCP